VNRRSRLYLVELVLAGLSTAVFVVTAFWPDWIERVTGEDGGDGGSGLLEWSIACVAALAAVGFSVAARIDWRRRRAESPPEPAS
jgi:hypothetical protein